MATNNAPHACRGLGSLFSFVSVTGTKLLWQVFLYKIGYTDHLKKLFTNIFFEMMNIYIHIYYIHNFIC